MKIDTNKILNDYWTIQENTETGFDNEEIKFYSIITLTGMDIVAGNYWKESDKDVVSHIKDIHNNFIDEKNHTQKLNIVEELKQSNADLMNRLKRARSVMASMSIMFNEIIEKNEI